MPNSLPSIRTLDDIRALLKELPGPNEDCARQALGVETTLTKPKGSLGRLEDLTQWMASWQNRYPPRIKAVHCNVYAGNHGIVARGVSAYPASVTEQMVKNFIDGGAAVNQLCATFNVDLQVHEMALDRPTADFTEAPAMSDGECAEAFLYGMTTVKDHTDLMCVGEMGIGNTTSAAALACALFGGEAKDWVGRGTGVDDEGLQLKADVVTKALQHHDDALKDGLEILRHFGGREMAAICGAVVMARLKKVPVLLDGFVCTAAAACLYHLGVGVLDHCQVAHLSNEPGHKDLCEKIGQKPLLDLDMRLGEASGAVLAVGLVRAALSCHNKMATFEAAGVDSIES